MQEVDESSVVRAYGPDDRHILYKHNYKVDDRRAKEWEAMEAEKERDRRRMSFESSGVGARFLALTLDDFVADTDERRNALAKVRAYISEVKEGSHRSLWLCGNAGCGKTFLAAMIVRECGGKFRRAYEISDEYAEAGSFGASRNREAVTADYAKAKVLVIDEVGRMGGQTEVEVLFRVLNARYEAMKPSVIVTNKTKRELVSYLGKSIFDRFAENSTSIEFSGGSYRSVIRNGGKKDEKHVGGEFQQSTLQAVRELHSR